MPNSSQSQTMRSDCETPRWWTVSMAEPLTMLEWTQKRASETPEAYGFARSMYNPSPDWLGFRPETCGGHQMRNLLMMAAGSAAMLFGAAAFPAAAAPVKNIVLVHGAWADGSGWRGVYDILTKDGFHVSVVANPDTGIPDDVAATQRVLDLQDGPVILVGHSYGGTVITEAGVDPKVVGLVYIAAFGPDAGETT